MGRTRFPAGIEEARPPERFEAGPVLYDIDELVVQVEALTRAGQRSHAAAHEEQTTRQIPEEGAGDATAIARSPTTMAFGPEAGLRLVEEIADADALRDYAPLPAARGDFLCFPPRPTGRGAFRIRGCGHADPQRAGKGLSPRAGGGLRRQALNPVSEAPLGAAEPSRFSVFSPSLDENLRKSTTDAASQLVDFFYFELSSCVVDSPSESPRELKVARSNRAGRTTLHLSRGFGGGDRTKGAKPRVSGPFSEFRFPRRLRETGYPCGGALSAAVRRYPACTGLGVRLCYETFRERGFGAGSPHGLARHRGDRLEGRLDRHPRESPRDRSLVPASAGAQPGRAGGVRRGSALRRGAPAELARIP